MLLRQQLSWQVFFDRGSHQVEIHPPAKGCIPDWGQGWSRAWGMPDAEPRMPDEFQELKTTGQRSPGRVNAAGAERVPIQGRLRQAEPAGKCFASLLRLSRSRCRESPSASDFRLPSGFGLRTSDFHFPPHGSRPR